MGQPDHGRRRRRPRRCLRYRGSGLAPRSNSFQDFGLWAFYDLLLPHIRGRARRRFFYGACGWLVLWFGVLGALLGWAILGPFGLFIGFGAGVTLGANHLSRNGYFRA